LVVDTIVANHSHPHARRREAKHKTDVQISAPRGAPTRAAPENRPITGGRCWRHGKGYNRRDKRMRAAGHINLYPQRKGLKSLKTGTIASREGIRDLHRSATGHILESKGSASLELLTCEM